MDNNPLLFYGLIVIILANLLAWYKLNQAVSNIRRQSQPRRSSPRKPAKGRRK